MGIVSVFHDLVPASSEGDDDSWQGSLRRAIRDPFELCARLGLPPSYAESARSATGTFSLLVPLEFVDRMRVGDPDDPLLRQVLPVLSELDQAAGYVADPLDERGSEIVPGLLAKYPGRALLINTGACAVHCRYCFRRHFPYDAAPKSPRQWSPVWQQLRDDASLEEVLLSGGDPLTLTDQRLAWLFDELDRIPHIRRIRLHTRLPIVIPSRVTEPLLQRLARPSPRRIVVLHVNHAAELDDAVYRACDALRRAGVLLLNQAVLLRGVNDSVEAQVALQLRLVDFGVVPYYLHQLDRVAGAHHFYVPEPQGIEIIRALRDRLPGYAVPRYVREVPGEPSKRPIGI